MDKIIKNIQEPTFKEMTTKEFFHYIKNKRIQNKQNKKKLKLDNHNDHNHEHNHPSDSVENNPPKNIEIVTFALLIDDVVVEVMHVQDSFAEILLKNPKFIKIEKQNPKPMIGDIYSENEFKSLEQLVQENKPTRRGRS